ncbi:MAG: MFS transporter [Chloroflexota bacterium]
MRMRRPTARNAEGGLPVIAFSTIAMTMTAFGQTSGVSVFVEPVSRDLGLARAEISAVYSLATLVAAAALPWMGRQVDLRGVRRMTIVLASAFGGVVSAMALASSLVWLGLGFVGLRMLGQGALSLAAKTAVAIAFDRHLGRAVAITGVLSAIGLSVVPFLLAALIEATDWHVAWAVGGVSIWLVVIPAARWLMPPDESLRVARRRPTSGDDPWTRRQVIRTPIFWLVTLTSASVSLTLTGFAFHQIAILGEVGLPPAAAAANYLPQTVAVILVLAVVAPLSQRMAGRWLMAVAMLFLAAGIAAVAFLDGPVMPIVYAAGLGGALGATQALDGTLYPRYFGIHAIAAIRGVASTVGVAGAAAGPIFVGLMRDLTGDFASGALALLVLPIGVTVACLIVKEPDAASRASAAPGTTR